MKQKWFTFDPSDGYITNFASKKEAKENFSKIKKLWNEVIYSLDEEKYLLNYGLICWGKIHQKTKLIKSEVS